MTRPLIILRPEPGNAATAAKARALGLEPHCCPLFATAAVAWDAPDPQRYVGVIMTSANAARLAGSALERFIHLPLYAVGQVTADAARAAGFTSIISGDGDVDRLLAKVATLGHHRLLHLSGADHRPFETLGVAVERRIVYASSPITPPPAFAALLTRSAVAMLHSPRAAAQFAALIDDAKIDRAGVALAAISANAAHAAGAGWERVAIAAAPRDDAVLRAAASLSSNIRSDD